jgi:hypothetical protein
MKQLTKQQIYNTVATHLFEQGEAARHDKHYCLMLNEKGQMCAFGCLFKEEDEEKRLDEIDSQSMIRKFPEYEYLRNDDTIWALLTGSSDNEIPTSLMQVHDTTDSWLNSETMRKALKTVAITHNLDFSILGVLKFKDR